MDIVNATSGKWDTGFYSVFAKKTLWSHQPIVINFDTEGWATMPNHGTRIYKMWLEQVPGLQLFEVFVNDVLIWSWSAEYLQIHTALRTSSSKTIPSQILLPIPEFFPVIQGMRFRITGTGPWTSLKADWIYDTLPVDGDYQITQVQTQTGDGRLLFRNVVKELVFMSDNIDTLELDFNSIPKIKDSGDYFQWIQPAMYHTANRMGVYTYSFCLRPEDDQPSGGVNMSRIQYVNLKATGWTFLRVYALSYNTLRVRNDSVTLLYDNL